MDHNEIRGPDRDAWQLSYELRAASRAAIDRAKALRIVAELVRQESRELMENLRAEPHRRR